MADDPLLPCFAPDRWLELERKAKKEGSARMSSTNEQTFQEGGGPKGGCARSVRCETVVDLMKRMRGKRGSTELTHIDIDTGTWTGAGGIGGAYVQVTIHILIKLDLSDVGDRFTEENDVIRQERRDAGKRYRFRDLPLEFMLLHEQLHARDICQALTRIAASRIHCDMTEDDESQLRRDMEEEYRRIVARADHGADDDDPGGVEGELEEDIRRRAWQEWDRRHPQ